VANRSRDAVNCYFSADPKKCLSTIAVINRNCPSG
jgi:hypothetical protein